MQFSDTLINDAISVFKDENDILLSTEEAIAVLDSLAGLFLAFAKEETRLPSAFMRGEPLSLSSRDIVLDIYNTNTYTIKT